MAPAYKITYFDVEGLGEPARYLLNYGNIEFEDNRIKHEQWQSLKPKTPYGQMPLLEHNGKLISQSVAITRYLGRIVGLNGKDAWEDLEIDAVVDSFTDMKSHAIKIAVEQDEAKKDEIRKAFTAEHIPYFMDRWEAQIKKNNGYFVNGKLTWADVYITIILTAFEPFMGLDFFSKYPLARKLRDTVVSNENYQKYQAKLKARK